MATNQNSLEDIINAEGILVSSDLHGNYNLISSGLKYAKEKKLAYAVNGDIVNDYAFKLVAKELGYKTGHDIQLEYLEKNLSKQDLEALRLAQNANQYGIEAILAQIPEDYKEQFEEQLKQVLEYTKSELFQKRIKKLSENLVKEKGVEIQENTTKIRALYSVFMDEEAKRFAEELNKYSEVKVLFNKGNHENVFFVENVKQYLTNQEQIVDLTEYETPLNIRNSSGSNLSLGAMTNCAQFMPYINEIFSEEEIGGLYRHTFAEKEFKKPIDVFLSHGQVGKPVGIENAFEVPYLESAKKASLEAKLTIEGHIHGKFEGKNEFERDLVRAAGEEAVIITKNGEKLEKKWIKLGSGYNGGHSNPMARTVDYYKQRVEQLLEEYELMLAQKRA